MSVLKTDSNNSNSNEDFIDIEKFLFSHILRKIDKIEIDPVRFESSPIREKAKASQEEECPF